ncbi:MAG: transglutaminase-like cysteine peptidase [Desulfovibrionaceae bacterium]
MEHRRDRHLHGFATLVCGLAVFCLMAWPSAARAESGGSKVKLFGTVEFKAPIKALPKWLGVRNKVSSNPGLMPLASLSAQQKKTAAAEFRRIKAEAKTQDPLKTITQVNLLFNKFPYRLDKEVYGVSDYWATPSEFIRKSGDCEDYSITKYYALKEMGFPIDDMRIVVLIDRIRGIAHAVLAVYINDTAYILDNLTNMVYPHTKFKHYVPQYSVNEKYRWAHVPTK